MYEELVAWLRSWSELPAHCECYESCDECDKQDLCSTFTNESIITKAGEAADAIEDLSRLNHEIAKRELKARMAKPRWIPATERLPEPYVEVLLYSGEDRYIGYMHNDKRFTVNASHFPNRPTHWMPLPDPPKEE